MLSRFVVGCVVLLVVSCDGQLMKSTYFRSVRWPNGTKLCAVGAASVSYTTLSVVACSEICKKSTTCGNFNFDRDSRLCTLFDQRPNCYGFTSDSCTHYELDTYLEKPNTGIPDKQCHIPFTYKKKLYIECGFNLTGDGCMSCHNDNWTLVRCQQPATLVALPIQTTISVPTFPQPIPVASVNGWIVFLYRVDGNLPFNETWIRYQDGFGDPTGEFWLGLEKLKQMTNNGQYKVRFEYKSIQNESWFSAEYASIRIDPESNWYKIFVSGYTGDGGSIFEYPNPAGVQTGMNFTTWDMDNDKNGAANCCVAAKGYGGWWYNACGAHSLTNPFGSGSFYSKLLLDLGLATDSKLAGARAMIQRI